MKEFIGAVTALFLCASAVLFSFFLTADSIGSVRKSIEELPLTINEDINSDTSEKLLGCVGDCVEMLNKRQRTLSLFINHRELDEIISLLHAVGAAVRSQDTGHYASSSAALRDKLEKLAESESLSLSAVF